LTQADGINVTVNGETVSVNAESSVAALLARLDLASQAVAVEVNLDLVPRAKHAVTRLAAGDRVEIVTLVGGG
jgi:sulfur carrier protein